MNYLFTDKWQYQVDKETFSVANPANPKSKRKIIFYFGLGCKFNIWAFGSFMHNLSKNGSAERYEMMKRLCLPGSQYNKELLILNMIPAKFPSQIWITISSVAFGISYKDRLVANFLKEQATKAEFRKLLCSDFLKITNKKTRSNEILQSSIKHFPFVRIINICRRLIFVMKSMIDCVATECFDIDKINYIFIMRFEKKLYCAWRQIDSFPPPAFNYN